MVYLFKAKITKKEGKNNVPVAPPRSAVFAR